MNKDAPQKKKGRGSFAFTAVFSVLSLLYVFPLVMMALNSFKLKTFISRSPFSLPDGRSFAGLSNYFVGISRTDFFSSFFWSIVITVLSVGLILLCTSMCAWYISRVRGRLTRALYYTFVFSMVVPFQMVMFTLSKVANILSLNTPWFIPIIYLGFGAGLAVFLFSGAMRSVPEALEEAAMIDGCAPPAIFFRVVLPILQPVCVSTGILQAMWIWNDYLLPYLVLDMKRFKTVPIAVQYLRGGYGTVDMGAMMAVLTLAILPILAVYFVCQRYIISGIAAGAVKG